MDKHLKNTILTIRDDEWKHDPWEVEQLEEKNTTEMNEIANNLLEKRNKEHYENFVGWKT